MRPRWHWHVYGVLLTIQLHASSQLELGRFFLTSSFSFRFLTKDLTKEENGQRQLKKEEEERRRGIRLGRRARQLVESGSMATP